MRIFAVVFCVVISIKIFCQPVLKREYSAQNMGNYEIKIDGILDEPAWKNAIWESDFIQIIPYEGRDPYFQTKFAILYDKKNIVTNQFAN